jgi:7,8-dihydropterin-6-yl-methyl-4-(beta-D-ribofuranosyl)aminobenzene 5'-phosphate synthase
LIPFCVAVACLGVHPAPAQPRLTFSRTFDNVRIRFLSTQLTATVAARAEWGFAALIEADDVRLLFDTGNAPDTATSNAQSLGIKLEGVHDLVLSHWHGDHVGGIAGVLKAVGGGDTRIYADPRIFDEKFPRDAPSRQVNGLRERRSGIEAAHGVFDLASDAREIRPGFALTGGVVRAHVSDQKLPDGTMMRSGGSLVPDTVPDEQSLIINTRDGLVIVTGCGHAGVVNTVEQARRLFPDRPVAAVVGGLHWFAAPETEVVDAGQALRSLGVSKLVGAHCTLVEPMFTLREHGWSREQAAVGAIGRDFFLKPPATAADRIEDSPERLASASGPAAAPSCHGPALAHQ